jgi:hypothetical protein
LVVSVTLWSGKPDFVVFMNQSHSLLLEWVPIFAVAGVLVNELLLLQSFVVKITTFQTTPNSRWIFILLIFFFFFFCSIEIRFT